MKVLVTGANGFIGSHLVKALIKNAYQVKAFVRPTSDLKSLEGLKVQLAYGDILQLESVQKALENCQLVFHVAGIFSYWNDSNKLISQAKEGMKNIMEAVCQSNIKRVILTSSSATLGASTEKKIITEEQIAQLDDAPAYVISKLEQEKLAYQLAEKYQIDLISVHPTLTVGQNDYGLTESNRMIVNYLKDYFKTTWIGGCNIVAVDDVARGHILAAEQGKAGEKYILGGENLEWPSVHRLISNLCGLPGPYLTAYHTSAFLASALHEIVSSFTGQPPSSSLQQAKMVGKYYWYDHSKIAQLGYEAKSAEAALTIALSWLVKSEYIPASLRASMELSSQIYNYRNGI